MAFMAGIFVSCPSSFDEEENNTTAAEVKNKFLITGTLVQPGVRTANSLRTAMPDFNAESGLEYSVEAKKDGTDETSAGEQTIYDITKQFSIKLSAGEWTIKATGTKNGKKVLQGTSDKITLGESSPVKTDINIQLYPCLEENGTGSVSLAVNFSDTRIKSAKTEWNSSSVTARTFDLTDKNSFSIDESGVPSGDYALNIFFYSEADCKGELLYMAHEVVNVFNELTTNTWQGSSPYFTESSDKKVSFDITADLVNKFRMSTYYVKGKGGTLGCVKKASDSNNGTFFDPFETFDKALAAVAESERNNDTGSTIDEYNIYIDGTVSVTQALVFNAKKKVNISSYADAAELKRTATSNLILTAESGSDTKISGITTDCSLYVKAGSSLALNSCSVTGTEPSGTEASANAVTVEKDGTFTVSDKVKICDKSVHNVYLKEGALITIGKGGLSIGSKIGVTLEKNPDVNNPCVTVTSGWGGTQVEKLIFSDDNYVAWKTGTPSEVCICVSSGSVTIPKFVVKFSIQSESETAVTTVARGDTITIVPQVYKDGTSFDATAYKFTAWKISLLNHGVDTGAVSSGNTITVPSPDAKGNKWPDDKYELYVTADYNDTTYSSKIPVNIK
ncbi:hypothetical protein [Treponema sp.]|uniref:hypothetical protein n=1 Tax=Treponema sp. TaxID=166 RepID=UPI003FD88C8B